MSNAVEIRAPAEQTEGTRSQILRWLKSVGEDVARDEPLIEIETDKVTVEVAAPESGVLREILKQEQEEIVPGELLGRIDATGVADRASASRHSAAQSSEHAQTRPDQAGLAAATAQRPQETVASASVAAGLSPAVRRLLAERGLSATAIRGTGAGGRITVDDVLSHAGHGSPASVSTPGAPAPTSGSSAPLPEAAGSSRRVPHSAVRKRIAEHMVQSLHTAPHVTTVFEADMTAVLAHRAAHKQDFARKSVPLTLTAYFLQATVAAIREVPEVNSRWTDSALEIFDSVHIGVATALDSGLVVPVLRDVQTRDLLEIARGLDDLTARARDGRLSPADMRGGTFTISNHGVSGSLLAAPIIINQPQSAILGVGKLERRVVARGPDDRLTVEPRCYVTLTIDHRVMDGHRANRFLQTFVQRLESSPG